MNYMFRFGKLFFYLAITFPVLNVAAYDYYCPRSNILWTEGGMQNGRGNLSMMFGGIDEPFPKSQALLDKELKAGWSVLQLQDCSSAKFECIEVSQYQSRDLYKKFSLFLPKKIKHGKEYKFKNMRLVTDVAVISPYMRGDKSRTPILQATIWQSINGKEVPIKLTVEKGRGVIYWDNLDFWSERFNDGELCVLQTEKGLFSKIKIEDIEQTNKAVNL